jgi:hypothetical protein
MQPCHAGFTEQTCSVADIQVRAFSDQVLPQPRRIPPWLRLSSTNSASSRDAFGKLQAEASVVATNGGSTDAHVYLRFRLYNHDGLQVAVCTNEPRPIFSDNNILVPGGSSIRIGCTVNEFEDVADEPSTIRVELLGWELRR